MPNNNICFQSSHFLIGNLIIIIIIIGFIIFYKMSEDERISNFCKNRYNEMKENVTKITAKIADKIPDNIKVKISNPLRVIQQQEPEYLPERTYVGRNDFSFESQQVGFIYNSSGKRFPLYENRRDRNYDYHIKDDTRTGIRILLNNPKHDQFYDGQTINVPEIDVEDFNVKLYEYSSNRYNPIVY